MLQRDEHRDPQAFPDPSFLSTKACGLEEAGLSCLVSGRLINSGRNRSKTRGPGLVNR
jgi:hypothetical protein